MTSLDDAETDIIRKLDELDARAVAEKLVAIRRRRGMLGDEIAVEGSPWISDFRHIRALAYWTLVQIERRYGRIHVRARQDIGDDWNAGSGEDLGLAIDDLILLVANRGDHDLSVSDETIQSLIEIRQERGREQESEFGDQYPADPEEPDVELPTVSWLIQAFEGLAIGDEIELNNFPRMRVTAIPELGPRGAIATDIVQTESVLTPGTDFGIDLDSWIIGRGRQVSERRSRVEMEAAAIDERTRREMVAAGEAAPPGPPTAGEVYALLEVGDHVVLNGMEYVVAVPCGPGFRTWVRTRPITGGIIEDVTLDDWIAQGGRKRDPAEYMPAPTANRRTYSREALERAADANVYRAGDGPTFVDTATDFGFPEPPPDPRLSLPAGSMAILERLEVGDMVEVEPHGRLEIVATWKSNPELVRPAQGGFIGIDDRSTAYRVASNDWEIGSGRYVNLQHEEAMRRLRRRDRDDDFPF